MAPLAAWHLLASWLALGQVTVTFRDGQLPTPAYAGTRDATIRDGTETPWQPGANYDTLDDFLGGAPDRSTVLLRFDLSQVPPSTTITGATLQVRVGVDAPGQTFPVYECLQPWTSTGANWDRYDGVTFWADAGATGTADHGAVVLGTLNAGSSGIKQVPLSGAGVAVVQAWIAGSTPNNGFLLQDYAAAGVAQVDQLNSGSAANWPQLLLGLPDGGTQVIDGGSDTTIASARDPRTVNDNTDHLNADGRPKAAALVAFDVSSIPPWSTVTAATLLLDCASDGTALPYSVYSSARPWVETRACWNTYAAGQPWAAAGADGPGDHGPTALGVLTGVGAPIPVALNVSGTQVIQDWIRGITPNYGFEIVEYNAGSDGIVCHSREEATISQHPGLQLVYLEGQLTFPGAPAAGGVGAPLGPFTLERRRLDGVAIASGAPALPVSVASSSTGGGFAADAGAAAWPATWSVSIPAGASTSGPFYMRDLNPGRPALLISAGIPWQPAQQVQSVRTVKATVPLGAFPVGGQTSLSFQAIDTLDVTSAVGMSARLLRTDGGVASSASFTATTIGSPGGTSVSGVAPAGAASFTVTDSVAERLQVCGSITGAPLSERCAQVAFSTPDHLAISLVGPGTTLPLEGCATETFKVQMVDDGGVPLASPSQASFCSPTDAGLVVGPSTFANETRVAPCVTGTLGPDGSATITLTPSFPVGFTVNATSPDVASNAIFGVQWDPGPPSPQATDLMWLAGADPKQMKIRQGTQVVRLIPRDACGFSALSRSSEVVLVLPDELLVGAPVPDYDAGASDRPIQLDVCPPAAADIFIRARAPNNQPVVDGAGAERVLTIVPLCNPRAMDVGCGGCASGPGAGPSAAALAMAAVILRAARRRRRAPAPARRSAAGP